MIENTTKKFLVIALLTFLNLSYVFPQTNSIKIIPKPEKVILNGVNITLKKNIQVYIDPRSTLNMDYVKEVLTDVGFEPLFTNKEKQAGLILKVSKVVSDGFEAYELNVENRSRANRVIANANEKTGLIYALQTLRQLVTKTAAGISIPSCTISDAPHFSWRAFMLDEGRHFHGKPVVKKLLDEMVRLKLNTFHWHLVDDPGWRIEIKKYPLLTEVASKGDHTLMKKGLTPANWDSLYNHKPGKFYTQEDIKEIVQYADTRGILIIPEIEVPGHASASIYAYPWLGSSSRLTGKPIYGDLYQVADPKVEGFLHDVLDEIISLFPSKIVHIGGDEADYKHWKNSSEINAFMKVNKIPTYTDLQVWAINRMSAYISSKGYRMIGWNEITGDNIRGEAHVESSQSEKLAPGTIVQFWDGEVSLINKAIEKGYEVVNSNRFFTYLDYPYNVTSMEKAYSFNPVPKGIAAKDRHKILGLGAQMWGEVTPDEERIYYYTFPRLAVFGENGWVDPAKKQSYQEFRERFLLIENIWKEKGYIKNQIGKY
ncbi:beta-N-acetylhexosaminidase [Pedobacter heparinus]|uniref:beta-N-acetylhexosaminidase n=1 Tax=Pedobacter heparinus TaxID=984 RepID=UPI00292E18F5|nr:beta-N-acetylhexosaminidase [Pedobacter heparinus]